MLKSPVSNLGELERRVADMPGARPWTEDSPVRFEIMEESIRRGKGGPGGSRSLQIMGPTMLSVLRSLRSLGANGLIITPEHGPRVRLAAVLTSIQNLPISSQNEHQWVEEYCTACGICVRKCPPAAIMPEPQRHPNGRITHAINERCFPYFSDYYGCSVCIKVCPFNTASYDTLKASLPRISEESA